MPNWVSRLVSRRLKLPKQLAKKLIESTMFNKPKFNVTVSLKNIREAFNSPLTDQLTKEVIITHLLDDSVNYNALLSNAIDSPNLGIQLNKSKKGHYFSLTNRNKPFSTNNPLALSILRTNNLNASTRKLIKGLWDVKDPIKFNKAFNATLWTNNYLGQLSKITDFIRAFIRDNDPQKLWFEGNSPIRKTGDFHYRYETIQEKKDTNTELTLARSDLVTLRNELSRFDWFANTIRYSDQHELVKSYLDACIISFDEVLNGQLPDRDFIDPSYLGKIYSNPELQDSFSTFSQSLLNASLLTTGDAIFNYGENEVLSINLDDDDIIENFVRIHGNSNPPEVTTTTITDFLEVNPRGSNEFRKSKRNWKNKLI